MAAGLISLNALGAEPLPALLHAAVPVQTLPVSFPAPAPVADLAFAEMFQSPVGRHGIEPSARLLALNGRRVRLRGYPVRQDQQALGQFWLTPLPLRMSEHADGEANDLPLNAVWVLWPEAERGRPLQLDPGLIEQVGILQWGRQDMADGSVTWLRLLVDATTSPP